MLRRLSGKPQGTRTTTSATRWGAGVLAALVVFGAGAAAGRATASDKPRAAAPGESSSHATAGREGAVPGPVRIEDGVPLGYAHSEEGAAAAAAQYATLLDGRVLLDEQDRDAALEMMAADSRRDRLARRFGEAAELIRERLNLTDDLLDDRGFVWRAVPAGWEIRAYGGSTATVAVWTTGIVMIPGRSAIQPGWKTTEVELTWERDDWRLVGFRTEEGPAPPPGDQRDQGLTGRQINELSRFWHVPPFEG